MNIEWGWDNARAILGLFVIVGIAWALSENRKRFPWKIVLGATAMMYFVILLLFWVPVLFTQFNIPGGHSIRDGLNGMNNWIDVLIAATREGTKFVFGPFIGDQTNWEKLVGSQGPIFIFQLLPLIIVIGSLSAILWHWGILKIITRGFAAVFKRTMGISGPASLSVAANIFMGQTEAPLLIKPYLKTMTRSELLIVMATGFATIAGSVLVVYVTLLRPLLPNVLIHLLTVSIIASPAAVALSLIMIPETGKSDEESTESEFKYHSTMDAFATGATDGIAIIWNIATMLIAALALVYIANAILGAVPIDFGGGKRLSLDMILGWLFAPLMYVAGVPWEEAVKAGSFVGQKTVFTEFVAFINLGNLPAAEMTERTRTLVTYAICGFANFGSMGILIGGLSIMCPERRPDFLALSWKTLFAGTLATIMAASVVGSLPYSLFKSDESLAPVVQEAAPATPAPVAVEPVPITTPAPAPEMPPVTPTPQTP
jgi:CNT family concentrative nucleoside transporter